jgi:phage minor structural protein
MLILYDTNHNKIGALTNYKDYYIEQAVNIDDLLIFSYPIADPQYSLIAFECYIRNESNEYIVKEINAQGVTNGIEWAQFVCRVNLEDLKGHLITNFETVEQLAEDSANLALAGTGWAVGYCDVTKLRTVRKSQCSVYDVMAEITKSYACEINYDSIHKAVNIHQKQGADRGAYFAEQLNLQTLQSQSNTNDYITRLIPIGLNGLDITSINDGINYVSNYQYSNKVLTGYWIDNRYASNVDLVALNTALTNSQIDATAKDSWIGGITSDNKLTGEEKSSISAEMTAITNEFTVNDAQATSFEITTEKTAYDNMYNTLNAYITPLIADTATESTISGSECKQNFDFYYLARNALLTAFVDKAKVKIDVAAQTLLDDAVERLAYLSKPTRAYSASIVDLANVSDTWGLLDFALGDFITLLSESKNVREQQRIVKIDRYLEEPERSTIQIANRIARLEDIILRVSDAANTVATATDTTGSVVASVVSGDLTNAHIAASNVDNLSATIATVGTLIATKAMITELTAVNANIASLTAEKANVTDLTASTARIDVLEADSATITQLDAVNANITYLTAASAHITNGIIDNAIIDVASVNNLSANFAHITSGIIDNAVVGIAAIGTTQIADGSITDAKIVGLTANKITAGTINAGVITVTNLNAANITVGTINGAQITDGAITNGKIGVDAVDNTKIADGAIKNENIFAATITGDKIVVDAITAREIATATITANEIAANAITANMITTGTMSANRIYGGTITGITLTGVTINASGNLGITNSAGATGYIFMGDGTQHPSGLNFTGSPASFHFSQGNIYTEYGSIYSGGNIYAQENQRVEPPGEVAFFAMSTPPAGWLKLNGATISRFIYADLFAAIGTIGGAGDGNTTFTLPDMRGYFARGWDDGRGVDSGRSFGSGQVDKSDAWTTNNEATGYGLSPSSNFTNRVMVNAASPTDVHPKNVALLVCIKY